MTDPSVENRSCQGDVSGKKFANNNISSGNKYSVMKLKTFFLRKKVIYLLLSVVLLVFCMRGGESREFDEDESVPNSDEIVKGTSFFPVC